MKQLDRVKEESTRLPSSSVQVIHRGKGYGEGGEGGEEEKEDPES